MIERLILANLHPEVLEAIGRSSPAEPAGALGVVESFSVATMVEAAEMLGVTERTFRRWSDRYEADGAAGLADRRLGRASARAK